MDLKERAEENWHKIHDSRRTSDGPREMTYDEVFEHFMKHVWNMIDYWAKVEKDSTRERLAGFAHSMLAMLDGSSVMLPRFIVAPDPCAPEDREFCRDEEKCNWYPENKNCNVKCDLSGGLHELLHQHDPRRKKEDDEESASES